MEIENIKFENFRDINIEVNNYDNYINTIKDQLKIYPFLNYSNFINESKKIYDDNHKKHNFNFDFPLSSLKNIFYRWRKTSNVFNKYSIFENTKSKSDEIYLRDYQYKMIYKKNGKNIFLHEHAIYCTNYFIRKLQKAVHYYIDGTFIRPVGYQQMIVILYYDEEHKKRFPGVYALINNKNLKVT